MKSAKRTVKTERFALFDSNLLERVADIAYEVDLTALLTVFAFAMMSDVKLAIVLSTYNRIEFLRIGLILQLEVIHP